MKRMNLLQMLMMVIMMAMVNNTFAQGRGGRTSASRGGGQREMVMNSNGSFRMTRGGGRDAVRGGGHEVASRGGHEVAPRGGHEVASRGGHEVAPRGGAPRVDHRGFVPGWEGRVRHHNGRWGYYRDNRWFWYDRYFDPVFYFGHPLSHFNDYYYIADGGYIPGWEGRVRYDHGRWGYFRDNRWLWYDRYYAPDYYFAHPVHHFHHHICGPVAAGVAGGIVGGAVLGTLISALCR